MPLLITTMSLNVALDIASLCPLTLFSPFMSACADREVKGDDDPNSNLNLTPETGRLEEETNEEVKCDSVFGDRLCSLMETRGS